MVAGDSKPPLKPRRSRTDAPSNDDVDESKPSPKKRRTSTDALLKPVKQADELGNKLGSLIGRKRKQRMAKKK